MTVWAILAGLVAASAALAVAAGGGVGGGASAVALLRRSGVVPARPSPGPSPGARLRRSRARPRDAELVERLALAGWRMSPEAFARRRKVGALMGAGVSCVLPWPGPLLAPILALAGARAPSIALARAVERRRRRTDAEVPQLLDLLAAASTAGLSAPLALRRATGALAGPLADELRAVLAAIDLGSPWRAELSGLADRLGLPDLRRAVAAITRTETLGASLATSTTELAARVREARRSALVERARTAPVKMLFPLVFLVLPSFLLLTVVPVLLTTLQSIR